MRLPLSGLTFVFARLAEDDAHARPVSFMGAPLPAYSGREAGSPQNRRRETGPFYPSVRLCRTSIRSIPLSHYVKGNLALSQYLKRPLSFLGQVLIATTPGAIQVRRSPQASIHPKSMTLTIMA